MSGLQILISRRSKLDLLGFFADTVKKNHKKFLVVLLLILFIILVFSHLVWFAERGSGAFSESYINGIGESIWWTIVTISTVGYGDFAPKTFLGRIAGALTIIIGFGIFSLLIAKLTSLFAVSSIKHKISSHRDLNGKRVATKEHTVAEDELLKLGARVIPVGNIEGAYSLLESREADAVVFDAPVIQHFLQFEGRHDFVPAGGVFSPHTYGIAVQEESEIREPINREILKLMESGEYDALHEKWFGEI